MPEKEIEVVISISLSKVVKISVDDYTITDSGTDEDSNYYEEIDYSDCDLYSAVYDQIDLPNKNDWDIDDIEIERI